MGDKSKMTAERSNEKNEGTGGVPQQTHRTPARRPAKQPRVPRTLVVKKRYTKYAKKLTEMGGRPLPMNAWVQKKAADDSVNKEWAEWLAKK